MDGEEEEEEERKGVKEADEEYKQRAISGVSGWVTGDFPGGRVWVKGELASCISHLGASFLPQGKLGRRRHKPRVHRTIKSSPVRPVPLQNRSCGEGKKDTGSLDETRAGHAVQSMRGSRYSPYGFEYQPPAKPISGGLFAIQRIQEPELIRATDYDVAIFSSSNEHLPR
ncbi:hypothetical protein M501DRAFT_1020578 [Patellaria atrata CBS 101060]|uniref:Uncharacterized protein n=1 Tax=Patellaria atrata CBS 101060 TaxID=1346257 RepID=A0A9P4S3H2_9PEZI|nr:hypothetical protein M501DRAFT_1020578 [Patellaria atrata CBS 101060]